jgi:hypothetical protein
MPHAEEEKMSDWIDLSGINESKESEFKEFSGKRYDGAKKIADSAEEKGGPALLTRDHFRVKLPYYTEAKRGSFDADEAKREYAELCGRLHHKKDKIETMGMKDFQEILGRMEALGELLIKNQDLGKTL